MFPNREARLRYLGFDDRLLVLIGIPLLAALATLLFVANQPHVHGQLVACIALSLVHTSVYWMLARGILVHLRRRYPDQRHTTLRIGLIVAFLVALVFVFEGALNLWLFPSFPPLQRIGYGAAPFAFEVGVALTLCTMVMAIYESVYFFGRYRSSLLEQERLTRANVQAQLATLKDQVNPHFLFNSLNTLVQIIPEDSDKAVIFTQRLSAVYRRILEYRHRDLIPLEEELAALRDYVFLMQTRFEDKLILEWTGAGAREKSLPGTDNPQRYLVPLSLQLLVENALKHNVVSQESPLRIEIRVDHDTVTVANDLRPRNRREATTGWGQENIRRRYRMATQREVVIRRTADRYSVSLPLLVERNVPDYVPA